MKFFTSAFYFLFSCRALTCLAVEREAMQSDRWQHSGGAKTKWVSVTMPSPLISHALTYCLSCAHFFLCLALTCYPSCAYLLLIMCSLICHALIYYLSCAWAFFLSSVKEGWLMNDFCCSIFTLNISSSPFSFSHLWKYSFSFSHSREHI